jgi:hypothetical protein
MDMLAGIGFIIGLLAVLAVGILVVITDPRRGNEHRQGARLRDSHED